MTATPAVQVVWHEYGDAGLLLDLVGSDYEDRWRATQSLGTALRENRPRGLVDVVASYQHVFVSFDPLRTDHDAVRAAVTALLGRSPRLPEPRRFEIPVVYGGDFGPDLDDVADELGLTSSDVVDLHVSGAWVVRFTGSPVGAPMMDGPRLPRGVDRMRQPRTRVPPGSVAISGLQSLIYVAPSPGGWRLIGRTPATLFDLNSSPHVPYRPGDRIRFRAIDADSWDDHLAPLTPSGR